MATTISVGSVGQDILNETFEGLQSEIVPVVEQIGERVLVADVAGSLFVEDSITGLAQSGTGIAIGADATPMESTFSTVSYECLRYTGYGIIPDAVAQSLQRAYNYDAIARAARHARQQAVAKLNNKLNSVLTDTNLNGSANASNWGAEAGTPIVDIDAGMEASGYGNALFLGRDVAEALRYHPDITAMDANYSSGAAIPQSSLVRILLGLYPNLDTVVIGNAMYNSANENQAVSLAYQFDGTAWCGHSKDLVLCYFSENSETQRIVERQAEKIYFEMVCDIIRPHSEMGYVFQTPLA